MVSDRIGIEIKRGGIAPSPQPSIGGASFAPCHCDGENGIAVADDEGNCVVGGVETLMS